MLGLKELHLPGLVNYVQNVNFDNVDKSMLRHIKIQELYERTKVVELLHQSAKYHGAAENELGCVKGWLEDLMEERWIIECGNVDPIRNWLNQLVRWLWGRKEGDTTDPAPFGITLKEEAITMGDSATIKLFAPQKEHELFNLRDAGIELLRNGFRNKEKKMIEYWSKIRGISNISNAYGDEIIGIYMRKLTRWDKMELPENSITKRRMWYFCLEHYVHWKEAVSHYSLALKMMNLLIVFHDLWGMHVEGMSNQEKKDFGVLHDNLYRFATVFQKPVEGDTQPMWQENECLYCFSKAASERISDDDRGRNLWMWLAQLAGVSGYGKYYASIIKTMTDGKDPEYVNQLFETHFWSPRTCSMMAGLKRIKDAMKKHAGPGDRMGGIKKNPIYNRF